VIRQETLSEPLTCGATGSRSGNNAAGHVGNKLRASVRSSTARHNRNHVVDRDVVATSVIEERAKPFCRLAQWTDVK